MLLGNGDGTFHAPLTYSSGGYEVDSIAVADVNGDGKPDLLVANHCASLMDCSSDNQPGSAGVLLGNGDGTFQAAQIYDSGSYYANSITVADVNGDGKPDLLVANCGGAVTPAAGTARQACCWGMGTGLFRLRRITVRAATVQPP